MPRGKRLSKKIYDKKKSNPKRNIRKSKKGGIFKTKKTSLEQLVSIPNSIQFELKQIKEYGSECFSQALITNIENVVGGFISGVRKTGVVECSSIKDMQKYGECENNKIDAYTKIRDLCKEGSNAVTNCSNKYFGYSYKTVFDKLSKNAENLRKIHQEKLDKNQDYQEYIKNQQQQARQQAQAEFNKEKDKYVEIIGNDLWPNIERYKRAEVIFFHEKNNEMVKLGTIKETKTKAYKFGGQKMGDDFYVIFSKTINSGTEDTEIRIGGTPGEMPAPKIPLYYEKDKKNIYDEALQEADESIEKEKKLKEEKEEKERQQQEEKMRQQEEEEYNKPDNTVDDKIAIRLKYNKDSQRYKSQLGTFKSKNDAYYKILEKMIEIRDRITKQEKEKENKKFQAYLWKKTKDENEYSRNVYRETEEEEDKKFQAYLRRKANDENEYRKRQELENEKKETAANQPGGKRRSRKKRNMKKSKKGKSKNRR